MKKTSQACGKKDKQTKTYEKLNKKEIRKLRSEIITERSRALKPLEEANPKNGKSHRCLRKRTRTPQPCHDRGFSKPQRDKIGEISRAIHTCQTAIDKSFDQLESLTEALDTQGADFQRRLEELASAEGL
jgi:ATP-binding cassette, subfamily F, member 3